MLSQRYKAQITEMHAGNNYKESKEINFIHFQINTSENYSPFF